MNPEERIDEKVIECLSLGAGVQSTTVLMMSIHGELPRLDHAIFSDTGWEPPQVYDHLAWLKEQAEKAGIPVHEVSAGNIKEDALKFQVSGGKSGTGGRWASMPYRVKNPDGSEGLVRRQCTDEYKIQPIKKKQRELMGLRPRQHAPKSPAMRIWFGISLDEVQRMRDPKERWATYYYPLVEKRMTRWDCLGWMKANGYPEPPRSACIGCPYHSNAEWMDMKQNNPEQFADAVAFDLAIRNCDGMRGEVFLHRSLKPLGEVDLRSDQEKGQNSLFGEECEGMCGT